jgi:hypothetical protein
MASRGGFSLVQPASTVFYDEDETTESAADAPWDVDNVTAFDRDGRGADLEDEELLEHMEREVDEYHRGKQTAAVAAGARRGTPLKHVPQNYTRAMLKRTVGTAEKQRARRELAREKERDVAMAEEEERSRRAVSAHGVSAGNRLYHDAFGKRRRAEERAKEFQAKSNEQQKECTFKPTITLAAQIVDRGPVVDRLTEPKKDPTKANPNHEQEARELEKCTFKPEVSEGTRRLTAGRSRQQGPVDTRLHAENEDRQLRQKLREKTVGAWERQKAIGGGRISAKRAEETVERMYAWGKNRDEYVELLRDEVTKPAYSVHADPAAVVARLTTPATSTDAYCETEVDSLTAAPPTLVNARSAQLAAHRRESRFSGLFRQLDVHGMGSLSLDALQGVIAVLEPQNVSILAALRAAGVHDHEVITMEHFCVMLENYERKYGPQSWGLDSIQRPSRAHKFVPEEDANLTFQPNANHVPGAMYALVPMPIRTDGDVHDRLYQQAARRNSAQRLVVEEAAAAALAAAGHHTPTITGKGSRATSRVAYVAQLPVGAVVGFAAQHRPASATLQRARSRSRTPTHGRGSSRDRDDDEASDVLEEIEEQLHQAAGKMTRPRTTQPRLKSPPTASSQPQYPRGHALNESTQTTTATKGLPPRSPSGSRRASPVRRRSEVTVSESDEEQQHLRDEATFLTAVQAVRQAREMQQKADRAASETKDRGPARAAVKTLSFPGQPETYNMAASLHELLYPVRVDSARVTPPVEPPTRPGRGASKEDLRRFGRDMMKAQLHAGH